MKNKRIALFSTQNSLSWWCIAFLDMERQSCTFRDRIANMFSVQVYDMDGLIIIGYFARILLISNQQLTGVLSTYGAFFA
jgi:hypothetical protein